MTVSIILCVLSFIAAIILAYAYIKYTNQKEKEFKIKGNELDRYKLAIRTIEKFVNMPEGKRLGLYCNVDNETLGLLSRCGFGVKSIFDLDKDTEIKEIYRLKQVNPDFPNRATGADLLDVLNANIAVQDRV